MKEFYESPSLEIEKFSLVNSITTSQGDWDDEVGLNQNEF